MLRLILLTLAGIGLTLTIAGRPLSDAELQARAQPQANSPKSAAVRPAEQPMVTVSQSVMPDPQTAPLIETEKAEIIAASAPVAPQQVAEIAPKPVDATPVVPTLIPAALLQAKSTPDLPTGTITGNRVNVRGGPSTAYDVVGQVVLGDIAAVTEDLGNGWVKIRIEGDGVEGYMSSRFIAMN